MFFYYLDIYIKESNLKGKNMKNTLAENLLRFRAKNLSETDRSKLAEQDISKKLPTATVTAKSAEKRLEASFKTEDGGVGTWMAYVKMDPKTKKWNLTRLSFILRGKAGNKDATLRLQGNDIMRGDLATILQNGELGYTGPGLTPLGSLNNLISQITKQTGLQLDPHIDLENTLKSMPNRYYTYGTATVPKGNYLKPGIEFGVKKLTNPETNQVIRKSLYIGNKFDPSLAIDIEADGKLRFNGPNSVATVLTNLLKSATQYINVSPTDDYAKDHVLSSIKSLAYQNL
jgi:hypothetical protein